MDTPKLKLLELFGGIGACSSALDRLKIEYEIVDYVEIDKYAVKSYNAIHGTNFEPQDICEWNKDIDVDLIMHGSPCFIAGTKILTNKGYRNIEDIQVGDMVLTHKNRYQKVIATGNKQAEIFRIKAQGSIETFVTGNHPYYVRTKSKKWNNEEREYERIFSKPKWKEVKDLTTNDFVGINIPLVEENKYELDKETCWLLGRYVADGHIRHNRRKERVNSYQYGVVYSIGESKIEEFRSHLKKYKPTITSHTKSCMRAVINSQKLVEFIESRNFGKRAINKDIPMFILNLPKNLAEEFLNGYMSGDGYFTNEGYKANSISQNLIMKLQLLIAKVYGTSSNINFSKRPEKHIIERRIVNQNPSWSIAFQKEIKKQNNSFVDPTNNIIWYPIKELKKLNTTDTVYNITVEKDHSYTANNLIVHNCQDFSLAGKQAGGDIGSGTRSSLMYETIRIVEKLKPKYVIWENVKNLLSKKHFHNFNAYLETMEKLGYKNYYQVLNAKDYGIPQNRERIFTISILNGNSYEFPKGDECKNKIKVVGNYMPSGHDVSRIVNENGLAPTVKENHGTVTAVAINFNFPSKQELKLRLKDLLENEVSEKYYLSNKQIESIKNSTYSATQRRIQEKDWCDTLCARDWKDPKCIRVATLDIKGIDQIKRVYDPNGISPTLTTMGGGNTEPKILLKRNQYATKVRKLTPRECWRLMGFTDKEFNRAAEINSNTQLYKQAGNSIVVNVLCEILKKLLKGE